MHGRNTQTHSHTEHEGVVQGCVCVLVQMRKGVVKASAASWLCLHAAAGNVHVIGYMCGSKGCAKQAREDLREVEAGEAGNAEGWYENPKIRNIIVLEGRGHGEISNIRHQFVKVAALPGFGACLGRDWRPARFDGQQTIARH